MLTDAQIEEAKRNTKYSLPAKNIVHYHNDCIRIAYEWLDAQKKIQSLTRKPYPIKHIIEEWAGRYISRSDVEVAATLHPKIRGEYPFFNISARLTTPSRSRLDDIKDDSHI